MYVTVGVLLKKLEAGLRGISHIIVDEIHERDINVRVFFDERSSYVILNVWHLLISCRAKSMCYFLRLCDVCSPNFRNDQQHEKVFYLE